MSAEVVHLSFADYLADPALSVSGAKRLLTPGCPALYKYERENGQAPRQVFDFGHAAHGLVLGTGEPVAVIDVPNWTTKAARERRDNARAEGLTPVLASEWQHIEGMAAAIKAHPIAAELLDPAHGKPEVSVRWFDDVHGIDRRARFDWLPKTDGGRLVIPDYKTCASADLHSISRSVANYGYGMQDDWYREAARALELAEDIGFVFIFQMKEPPYLVTVVELDSLWQMVGRIKNDRACQTFAECVETDTWPGFADGIELIGPPQWALNELDLDSDMAI